MLYVCETWGRQERKGNFWLPAVKGLYWQVAISVLRNLRNYKLLIAHKNI